MAISATKWLTTCLHYNEHWETLLSKAVKPFTDVVLQTGVAECFYFERSMERGPHLRLHFKSTEYLLENILKPNLLEHFQQYFEAKPSFLVEPKYPASFPEKLKWHPNNSIHFDDGQPEHKLGVKPLEMSILAAQYQASSCMVLNTLKDKNADWSQAEKINTALKLHLSMLYAFGITLKEAAGFTAWALDNWEAGYLPKDKHNYVTINSESLRRTYHSNFELQRKDMHPYLSAIWELLKNYQKVGDQGFIDWIHANSSTNLELSLALDAEKVRPLPTPVAPQEPIWTYYADFIQKTNNRLGINGVNEGYLFFALAQSLKLLKQGNRSFIEVDSASGKFKSLPILHRTDLSDTRGGLDHGFGGFGG